MATYGYSTPYTGQRQPTLPPGYMEAATAPGRYIAAGIQQLGAGIGQALERYQQGRQESEYLNQRLESLAPYIAQTAGQAPEGSPEAKLVSSLEKYSGLSNAKKKALLADTEFFLRRKDDEVQRSIQQETLNRMRQETQGGQDFINALSEVSQMVPGQGVQIPYTSPTAQILSQYGRNLTPAQAQTLAEQIQIRTQAPPPGMIPSEATYRAPGGGQVTYTKPQSLEAGSIPIPGTNKVQPTIGGKPVGSLVDAQMAGQVITDYSKLPENLQKTADALRKDFRNEKTLQNAQIAGGFLNQMEAKAGKIGTPDYKASDDIALIFSFMKTLDPGSTIQQGEYANAQNAGGVPERIVNIYNKARSGEFLTDEQRKDFINTARLNLQGLQKEAQRVARSYQKDAKARGIPEYLVVDEDLLSMQPEDAQKTQGDQLPRFNSIAEAEANLQPGQKAMVFDPAIRKRREFIKQ